MRKLALSLAVAAVCSSAGLLADRAVAAGSTGLQGIRAAIDDVGVIEKALLRRPQLLQAVLLSSLFSAVAVVVTADLP
jgi:hypothetical protein